MRRLPLLLPLLLALCAQTWPCAPGTAWAAEGAAAMTQDVIDSLTKAPASDRGAARSGATRAGNKGPAAPTPPVAPKVSGAAPSPLPGAPGAFAAPARGNAASQSRTFLLKHDGVQRRALVVAPRGANWRPAPAIIFLHGAGGSAEQAMRQTGLAERAASAGFLAVFPEGLGARHGGQTWNTWDCCGYARDHRVDDVGFLAALITRLKQDGLADPKRIYLAGFSNGAVLASRFALERPGVATAIAVVSGDLPCDAPKPQAALPVLLVSGAHDALSRLDPTPAHPATGRYCADHPARFQAALWAQGMGLGKPRVSDSPNAVVREEAYGPAKSGARGDRGLVRHYILKRGGHSWPGGVNERYPYCDLPCDDMDATGLILRFFTQMR